MLLAAGEVAIRWLYVQDDPFDRCGYKTAMGLRYRPSCASQTKIWEGPWITQQFNDCGYRTAESCSARPAGSLRVAVIGASIARGARVKYEETFSALSSAFLSKRCGDSVDFQNLGTWINDLGLLDQRVPEALALRPSAIILTISPYDLEQQQYLAPEPRGEQPAARFNLDTILRTMRGSRLFVFITSKVYYHDPSLQVKSFLRHDDQSAYVRPPLSPAWQKRLADFGAILGRITAQTAPAHVPVLVFLVPDRVQAALQAMPNKPPGVDPLALGLALKSLAAQLGAKVFDATGAFASVPDFGTLYFVADGHPRPAAHAALAGVVEQALLSEPAFARCAHTDGK